jgi:hypothetical protein
MPKYRVEVCRVFKPVYEYTNVEIEAEDASKALNLAIDKAIEQDDWDANYDDYNDTDYTIEDVQEIEK